MSLRAPTASPTLATRLAARVRTGRAARRLTRANLADASGLSMAYLARLEGAQANPSLEVLTRLATALQLPPHALIAPEEPEWAPPQAATIAPRIALIGLRGAGKSTLGVRLAQRLGCPFVELNQEVARAGGLSVPEIFDLVGEPGFRALERECLEAVIARHPRVVLATGGGIVGEAGTFARLRGAFTTVWLRAAPSTHFERVRRQQDRRIASPALHDAALRNIARLLDERDRAYALADLRLDTEGRTPARSLLELQTLLRARAG